MIMTGGDWNYGALDSSSQSHGATTNLSFFFRLQKVMEEIRVLKEHHGVNQMIYFGERS